VAENEEFYRKNSWKYALFQNLAPIKKGDNVRHPMPLCECNIICCPTSSRSGRAAMKVDRQYSTITETSVGGRMRHKWKKGLAAGRQGDASGIKNIGKYKKMPIFTLEKHWKTQAKNLLLNTEDQIAPTRHFPQRSSADAPRKPKDYHQFGINRPNPPVPTGSHPQFFPNPAGSYRFWDPFPGSRLILSYIWTVPKIAREVHFTYCFY